MTNIVVPELGESVVEARVARWLKKEGDRVEVGEPVVELETEKIDLEVNAETGGVIASIKRQEGEDVKIGELLAVLDESAAGKSAGGDGPAAGTAAAPATTASASTGPREPTEQVADGPKATPTARRMAKDHDVKLDQVQGSGSAGRVMKQDVQSAIAKPGTTSAPATPSAVAPAREANAAATRPANVAPSVATRRAPGDRVERRERMSKRRATIARRLVEAQRTAAM